MKWKLFVLLIVLMVSSLLAVATVVMRKGQQVVEQHKQTQAEQWKEQFCVPRDTWLDESCRATLR